MERTLVVALVAALVFGGTAYALESRSEPKTSFEGADLHVGDALRYSLRENGTEYGELVLAIEGSETIKNAAGTDVRAAVWRIDEWRATEYRRGSRCFVEPATGRTVALEFPSGGREEASWSMRRNLGPFPVGSLEWDGEFARERDFAHPCAVLLRTAGVPFDARGPVPLSTFMEIEGGAALHSTLPEPVELDGRAALRYSFDLRALEVVQRWMSNVTTLRYMVTVVEGIPGVAVAQLDVVEGEFRTAIEERLVAYVQGPGARLARGGAPMAPTTPSRVPFEPLLPPTSGIALAYAAEAALQDIRADPLNGADGWLQGRPDAILHVARYAESDHSDRTGSWTEATWTFHWGEDFDFLEAGARRIVRDDRPTSLPGVAPLLPSETWAEASPPDDFLFPLTAPNEVADPASLASVVDAHGFAGARALAYEWDVDADERGIFFSPRLYVLREEEDATRRLVIDASEGVALAIERGSLQVTERGLLGAATESQRALAAAPPVVLEAPPAGAGLAVPAAALGGALLVLLLKALLPLYTRLRRENLLDNAVRARLYERVRAEAGITRAELVDAMGIGEGATDHHLRLLLKHGYLARLDTDGAARFYAAGEVPPEVARQHALLRSDTARALFELEQKEPGLSLRDAARRLGVSAPTVHRARRKLREAGLLRA